MSHPVEESCEKIHAFAKFCSKNGENFYATMKVLSTCCRFFDDSVSVRFEKRSSSQRQLCTAHGLWKFLHLQPGKVSRHAETAGVVADSDRV